jgi:hypothetical protein
VSGEGQGFSFQFFLEDHLIHGSLELVLEDGEAFLKSEVFLSVDKLAVDALVLLVDEVHTEIV